MKEIVRSIIQNELNSYIESIAEIQGLGSVNRVFEVQCKQENYIVRINEDTHNKWEYAKEKWCIEKVSALGVPVPKVLQIGTIQHYSFMVQNKLEGINGTRSNATQQVKIWRNLGTYAVQYHTIPRIEVPEVEAAEFHKSWKNKLQYNLDQLSEKDSLLQENALTQIEQNQIKFILYHLEKKHFDFGLVHGDLCPRNVIFNPETAFLIDWGTAEINIVPHTEIGIILMETTINHEEFLALLEGMQMTWKMYQAIETEVRMLNVLHRLDKYRWAKDFGVENMDDYEDKLISACEKVNFKDIP